MAEKKFLDRLLFYPKRKEIGIDFERIGRFYRFSLPLFSSYHLLPSSVRLFLEKRQNKAFLPHRTYYQIRNQTSFLIQELSFDFEDQATLRFYVERFWQLAQKSFALLWELVEEERRKEALSCAEQLKI